MPTVKILGDDLALPVAEGDSLADICYDNDTSVTFGCFAAQCGYCRIHVVEGHDNLSPMEEDEQAMLESLDEDGIAHGYRLACQCQVLGDVIIEVVD